MPESRSQIKLEATGTLSSGVKDRYPVQFSGEITDVGGVLGTVGTVQSTIIDIKKNGTSIYTTTANRPTAAISASAVNPAGNPDVTTFVDGDVLSLDVIQFGTNAADLDLVIEYVAS